MLTMRSPLCGYDTLRFVELTDEDFVCYSNKNESVGLNVDMIIDLLTERSYAISQ